MIFNTKYSDIKLPVEVNTGDYEVSVDGYSDDDLIKFFAYSDLDQRDLDFTFDDGIDDEETMSISRSLDIVDVENIRTDLNRRASRSKKVVKSEDLDSSNVKESEVKGSPENPEKSE